MPQVGAAEVTDRDPATTRVAATFYGWYRHPSKGFFNADGSDRLAFHFPDPGDVDFTSATWVARELDEMHRARIDVALAAVGAPREDADTAAFEDALAKGHDLHRQRTQTPVQIAPLLDFVQLATHLSRGLDRAYALDLHQDASRDALRETVRGFLASLPSKSLARLDGRLMVVVHHRNAVSKFPPDFWEQFRNWFRDELGEDPFIALDASWGSIEGFASFDWTAPLRGAVLGEVTCLGPGFDDTCQPGRTTPLRRRDSGSFYLKSWQQVLAAAAPRLVIIESWNDHADGTGIEPTVEAGDNYVERTRECVELLHRGQRDTRAARSLPVVVAARGWHLRAFAGQPCVDYVPWNERSGMFSFPAPGSPLSFARDGAGNARTVVAERPDGGAETLLSVADSFATEEALDVELRATLRSLKGEARVCAEAYVEDAPGSARPRRFEEQVAVEGELRELSWRIPRLRFSNLFGDGADVKLVADGAFEIAALRLERKSRLPPTTSLAASDSTLVDASVEDRARRILAIQDIGLPLLRVVIPLRRLVSADGADAGEIAALLDELASVRIEGMVALSADAGEAIDPKVWLDAVPEVTRQLGSRLRYLEVLPRFAAAGIAPVAYALLLREIADRVHDVRPDVVVCLGAVAGIDASVLREVMASRALFSFDVVVVEANAVDGDLGSRTLRLALHDARRLLEECGAGDHPLWLVAGAREDAASLAAPDARPILGRLLRDASRILELESNRVLVYQDDELPVVHGIQASLAHELLREQGFECEAVTREGMLGGALDPQARILVLPNGEIVPSKLVPVLLRFIDSGGLIVNVGGAPFQRTATFVDPEGTYRIDASRAAALSLRDELRIAVREGAERDRRLAGTGSTSGLLDPTRPFSSDFFPISRRTGRPRNERQAMRYVPLMRPEGGSEHSIGDAAGLWVYSGACNGGLLAISLACGGPGEDEERTAVEADALARELRDLGVERWFWSELVDSPDPRIGRAGLLRPDSSPKKAASIFRAGSQK